ncbi:MAG: LacI family DNA-binding transcriptional regulator [Hellea sp.]
MEPRKNKSRATSYDVARLAGVSQSAVSRCFKPGASVSKKMRDKVMAAANELHYQPNAIARGLITRRSNLVAVMVSARLNFYYPEALFSLTERLSAQNMRVLLFTVESEDDVDAVLDQVLQYSADGVISASHLSVAQHELLERRHTPVIMFNRYFDAIDSTSVWCDVREAATTMIEQLLAFGHKKFAFLHGPADGMVGRERLLIAREILTDNGITDIEEASGDYTYESASAAIQNLRKRAPDVTAILCANDMMAMGAVDELRHVMGLNVPRDISVVGFDGLGSARFASYELTTVRQPIGRMSDAAVSMLMERVEKPETSVEKRVLTGSFIQGTSSGPAPQ